MKLMCPVCRMEYESNDYPKEYSPEKYVPHHGIGSRWCMGTEQRPMPIPKPGDLIIGQTGGTGM